MDEFFYWLLCIDGHAQSINNDAPLIQWLIARPSYPIHFVYTESNR
ncbi:MAG: hypothetical protein ACI845_002243 [Gammaproteobacteria bacterium]|jgi:hypothetical protein